MKKIMFNDRYGLTKAVLDGTKTMTRRVAGFNETERPCKKGRDKCLYCKHYDRENGCKWLLNYSSYNVGEVVAVAQCYEDAILDVGEEKWNKIHKWYNIHYLCHEKGLHNKMFVRADLMPHQIRITDIKVERLQDISDDDCLREGVVCVDNQPKYMHVRGYAFTFKGWWQQQGRFTNQSDTPRGAFAALIDKVSGKGTWERNPYVFAYTFKLIK